MAFGQNYNEADYNNDNLQEGDYLSQIVGVEDTKSRNGNYMRVVDLKIREANFTFKHYLVENEYFDSNMTRFFDCFRIQRGNFDDHAWLKRTGTIHVAKGKPRENGKSYWEVQYLVTPQAVPGPARQAPPAQQPPRQQAPAPANRTQWPPQGSGQAAAQPRQQQGNPPGDDFTDDIPF